MTYSPKCHYLVMVVLIIFCARASAQQLPGKNRQDGGGHPNPVCNYCRDSMQITLGAGNASYLAPNMATIHQQFSVSPKNIIKITAAIVFVKDSVTSGDCRICAPHENEVFQFVNTNTATGFGCTVSINPVYYGSSTSPPSKVVAWISGGAGGANIATPNSVQLNLHIGLPAVSALTCCSQWEKICIRYTFWDVGCKACDRLVCYTLKKTNDHSHE